MVPGRGCGIWLINIAHCFFFFKQKTAYEMRISDWSSDVCSSDLLCTVLAYVRERRGRWIICMGCRNRFRPLRAGLFFPLCGGFSVSQTASGPAPEEAR